MCHDSKVILINVPLKMSNLQLNLVDRLSINRRLAYPALFDFIWFALQDLSTFLIQIEFFFKKNSLKNCHGTTYSRCLQNKRGSTVLILNPILICNQGCITFLWMILHFFKDYKKRAITNLPKNCDFLTQCCTSNLQMT